MVLEAIGSVSKRNWSGYDFFGFYRKDVMDILSKQVKLSNAGPTENLSSKQAMNSRNKMIDAVVYYASFDDLKS